MPTGAGSLQGRKLPISTGLCESGQFSTTIREYSRPDSSTIREYLTYRRQVVIKTSSRSGWPCGNKNKRISESKARIEGGSAAATRPSTPLSLSAKLCGPALAVKGSASPRFASRPMTAAGRAWGLAVYEGRGGTATVRIQPGALAQRSGFATIKLQTCFQGVRDCKTVLQERFDWRRVSTTLLTRNRGSRGLVARGELPLDTAGIGGEALLIASTV